MTVTGSTRLFAVVGDPVAQVRSPEVFGALFRERGIDAVMVPCRVPATEFELALRGMLAIRNLEGLIVTVPHKIAAARLAARLGPNAAIAASANALRRGADGAWEGELFDGLGFAGALQARGLSVEGKRVLLVGAGGVGSAIGAALLGHGFAALALHDVLPERARSLAARLQAAAPAAPVTVADDPDPHGFGVVINASPLGMQPDDPLPLDPDRLEPGALVADVIMQRQLTTLLSRAAARGCTVLEGRHMLDQQAPLLAGYFGLGSGT